MFIALDIIFRMFLTPLIWSRRLHKLLGTVGSVQARHNLTCLSINLIWLHKPHDICAFMLYTLHRNIVLVLVSYRRFNTRAMLGTRTIIWSKLRYISVWCFYGIYGISEDKSITILFLMLEFTRSVNINFTNVS